MDSTQSTLSENALISVRLVTMDYYQTNPSSDTNNQLDPIYSMFRSAPVKTVPVLRIFGPTPAGQKACLHIHGIFPYLYVPMPQGDHPGYLYRLAASLDKALNMSMYGSGSEASTSNTMNSGQHHVYKIVEVTGKPYYGYHSREHRFAKIYLYNPYMLKRASDLLASGSVLGTILQPHYGHIPYGLQFMMDYNLQGMSLIHLKIAKFRHSNPTVTYRRDSQLGTPWEGYSQPATQRLFKIEDMTEDMLGPDSLPPMTVCDIEIDAVACDIMNSNVDLMSTLNSEKIRKSGNPGLEHIWEDERLRRIGMNLNLTENPLTPPSSPPRERSKDKLTDSEKFWNERFDQALEEWRQKGVLDTEDEVLIQSEENLDSTVFFDPSKDKKKIVYPDETINESLLQAAMTVEDHLSSLSISSAENFSLSNNPKSPLDEKEKHSFFEDTFVDETSVIEVLSSDSNKIKNIIQNESQVGLDSDDEELVELLQELKQYNDAKASTSHQESENESTQSSLNLSEFSQRQRDNYEKEVTETLEMSQLIWDEDPFDEETTETPLVEDSNVDFDNDSFWDNYDFDSVLN